MHPYRLTADLLTLSRLPLAGAVWLLPGNALFVLGIMFAAGISDVLDGWFARRAGPTDQGRSIGAWLDPVCDKLFLASILLALWHAHDTPPQILAMTATRDLLQAPLYGLYGAIPGLPSARGFDFSSVGVSKATTGAQFLTVAAILVWPPATLPLALCAAALGLLSVWLYGRRLLRHANSAPAT